MKSNEVLKKVVGENVKKVAGELGISQSMLYKMQDGSKENYLDKILKITRETNNLDLIKYLCLQSGGYYVSIQNEEPDDLDIAKTVKEFGEFLSTYSGGYADGKLTEKEKYDILKEGAEAVAAIEFVMQKVAEF